MEHLRLEDEQSKEKRREENELGGTIGVVGGNVLKSKKASLDLFFLFPLSLLKPSILMWFRYLLVFFSDSQFGSDVRITLHPDGLLLRTFRHYCCFIAVMMVSVDAAFWLPPC